MNSERARELVLAQTVTRGDSGEPTRRIQEWLGLHGINVAIDGAFGPATQAAVMRFQTKHGLASSGAVDNATFAALVAPMQRAARPLLATGRTLSELTLACARQHLAEHPREIGGQNMGPWVRLYMNGNQGLDFPWCAGFVSYCLKEAASALGAELPIMTSFSCDALAASAKQNGRFLTGTSAYERSKITPGSLFLIRKTDTDWIHTGIVAAVHSEHFESIEGNTNEGGSTEGIEVRSRFRDYGAKDFVLISVHRSRM